MDKMIKKPQQHTLILWSVIIAALALRLFLLGSKSFWVDEGVTWFIGTGEIHSDAHPPLYFAILHFFISLLGDSEFAGRLPSALFGWLTVITAYIFGKENFGEKYGLWLAGFIAASPFMIPVSQEMRMYALIGFELFMLFFFYARVLKTDEFKWLDYLGLFITAVAALYTFSIFTVYLAVMAMAFIIIKWRRLKYVWLRITVLTTLMGIAYIPQLLDILVKTKGRERVFETDWWHVKINIIRVFRSYIAFFFGERLTEIVGNIKYFLSVNPYNIMIIILMLIVIVFCIYILISGLKKSFKQEEPQRKLFFTCMILSAVFSGAFFFIAVSTSRQMMFIYVPFVILFMSILLNHSRKIQYSALAVYLLLSFFSLNLYYRAPLFSYERADWRSAGELIKRNIEKSDGIFCVRERNSYYALKYYLGETGNDVYYRYRPNDPDLNPAHYQITWDPRNKTPFVRIDELMSKYPRMWVLESDLGWGENDPLADTYYLQVWDLGPLLQVRLYSND